MAEAKTAALRRQPRNITLGVDDPVPPPAAFAIALQHVVAVTASLVYAILIAQAAGSDIGGTHGLIQVTVAVSGVTTILMCLKRGPIGCGYLCPSLGSPTYLAPSLLAAGLGGLPLVYGMLIFGSVIQVLLSRVIQRLRSLLTSEVSGVIITMVGVSLVPKGVALIAGYDEITPTAKPAESLVGLVTLAVICAVTVWGGARFRAYSILVGVAIGYLMALPLGLLAEESMTFWRAAAIFGMPAFHAPWNLRFEADLILPFAIAALVVTVKGIGVISTAQKINDQAWTTPEMGSVRGGLLANGIGCLLAGLAGGIGVAPQAGNVGLSLATGVTSRVVGIAVGGLLILLAFSPLLTAVFVIMPAPVMGAVLIYIACFVIVSGLQLVMSHTMTTRSILTIGVPLVAGLSVDFLPELYDTLPPALDSLTGSPLAFASVVAVLLNLLFRIAIWRRAALALDPKDRSNRQLSAFLAEQGAEWSLPGFLVRDATETVIEALDVALADADHSPVALELRYDQIVLEVTLRYRGPPIELPSAPPEPRALVDDPAAVARLSGFLIRQATTEVSQRQDGEENLLRLRFAS
ncbi:MAG: solute carrier family 23 protein [Pseudomonadota bacterium]